MNDSGRSTGERGVDRASGGLPMQALLPAWIGLVAIGCAGRLFQPTYNVTPLVGIALCAGAFFPHPAIAATVPAVALAASNLALPGGGSYGNWLMAAVVYGAFMWPVLVGPLVRGHRIAGTLGGALAGSLVFFLSTNFVHWCTGSDYPHTVAGLAECFTAALPFYRWMPVGDLVWSAVLVAGMSAFAAVANRRTSTEPS